MMRNLVEFHFNLWEPLSMSRSVCVLLLLTCSPWLAENYAAENDAAENYTVENLGVAERQVMVRGHAFSPGTKEYPARLLIGFTEGDGTWVVNLEDGTSRKADSAGFDEDYIQWPSFIGADGKVFSACGRGGLSVFDPVANTIKLLRPIPEARWLRGMAIGPDGAVFVSDYPTGSAAKYNPNTGAVTRFGRQGGPFTVPNVYGYSVGCDGRHVYTAAGKMPWYVVAYDTTTGVQKNLLRFEPSDHPEVHQRGDQVFLAVAHGSPPPDKPATTYFRLLDGRAEAVDSIPKFDDSYVPGNGQPQPVVQPWDRHLPIVNGKATLKYRKAGQTWSTATIPVAGQEMTIERITPLANGQLLVSTGAYGNVFRFDPQDSSFTLLGNPASKNVYDMLELGGRVYFCGYPNSILGLLGSDDGTLIGSWHDTLRSKHALFLLEGADGRIYSGNHNERESTGGALGWYDLKTGKFGGLHFPNDDCEYLTSALAGKLIVYASDFSADPAHPEIKKRNGKLLVFDTTKGQIVSEVSPLSDGSAGVVIESEPGILFGLGLHDKVPVMYSVELATGKVGQRVPLPARAVRQIARGPDGKVYFFMNGTLVRANPKTFQVESLCQAEPGRMAFIRDDLYIAGTSQLRRIVRVTSKP